ncbi:MAG: RNA-binding cell elongation regulator Jag/EloR [Acidimicrobiales bacterium]
MEWVEVTGVSVDVAKESALDQLGVAEPDAEIVVVSEPKSGLFGRVRGEARVRARVRPVGPRPKRTRRPPQDSGRGAERGGQRSRGGRRRPGTPAGEGAPGGSGGRKASGAAGGSGTPSPQDGEKAPASQNGGGGHKGGATGSRANGRRRGGSGRVRTARTEEGRSAPKTDGSAAVQSTGGEPGRSKVQTEGMTEMAEAMTLEEQAEVASTFLEGLVEQYGLEATVETRIRDEETVELAVNGEGLGVLVGPKGATLAALQDVTRTAVQHRFPSRTDRVLVDVAGYRERRTDALQRFSRQVVSEVVESGEERALEPMSPADRKVVHDTVNDLDGVATRSEGEEPYRYVVISPAD